MNNDYYPDEYGNPPLDSCDVPESKLYRVYYMKPGSFRKFNCGDVLPKVWNLDRTHTFLRSVEAGNLEEVFVACQGEIWSPQGEANGFIRARGLAHTSMSVGDVVEDENGVFHAVAGMGFKELGRRPALNLR